MKCPKCTNCKHYCNGWNWEPQNTQTWWLKSCKLYPADTNFLHWEFTYMPIEVYK